MHVHVHVHVLYMSCMHTPAFSLAWSGSPWSRNSTSCPWCPRTLTSPVQQSLGCVPSGTHWRSNCVCVGGWIGRSKKGKERGGGRKEWIEKSTCTCSTTLSLLPTQHHNIHVDTVKPRKLNLPNKLDHTEHIKWAWVHTSVFTHKMVMIAYPWILSPSKI